MKASAQQIAKRYVTALFSAASTPQSLVAVERDLVSLAAAHTSSDAFRAVIKNPLLTRDQQQAVMTAILQKIKADSLTVGFISTLAQQKRLNILPEIIDLFTKQAAVIRGELDVEMVAATNLSDKEVDAVSGKLAKAYGKKVMTKTRVDDALLGGVIINIGSVQLDASLNGKLRRLSQKLKAAS